MSFAMVPYEEMAIEEIEGLGIEELESRLEMAAAITKVDVHFSFVVKP